MPIEPIPPSMLTNTKLIWIPISTGTHLNCTEAIVGLWPLAMRLQQVTNRIMSKMTESGSCDQRRLDHSPAFAGVVRYCRIFPISELLQFICASGRRLTCALRHCLCTNLSLGIRAGESKRAADCDNN